MLQILLPEETRNYCLNPSLGNDVTYWSAVGVGTARARVLSRARFGRASLQVTTPGTSAGEGAQYDHPNTIAAGSPVTGSVYVRGSGQVFLRLRANINGRAWDTKPITLNDRYWQRLVVTGVIPGVAETDLELSVRTAFNHSTTFYVDGCQIELKGHVTTYCDGDLELELRPHDGGPYFEWVGQRHTTESFRSRTYRMGGVFKDLTQGLNYDLFPIDGSGLGMPRMTLATQVFAGGERTEVQRITPAARAIGLTMEARRLPRSRECDPKSFQRLHAARKALEDAIKPDLTHKVQSFLLRWQGECPMDLEAVYESGMEWTGDFRQAYHNEFLVRLLAPDPFWRSDSQDAVEMDVSTTIPGGHAYLVARLTGEWQGFGSASFPIRVLAVHPNGDVYAGGSFTNIGGVACRRIARWDGEQWNILAGAGNDIDDGEVYAIGFAANGDVYIGGTFTTIDAVTYNRVARYDPDTDSFDTLNAAGTVGVNSDVNAIVADKSGYVWIGGAFTTAGGAAAYRIVRYNGPTTDTFTAIGAHSGLNLDVEALELDLDGSTIYIGGQFTDEETHAGGTALPRICKYTAASGFEAMGEYGLNGTCFALAMGLDGKLYLGGSFTTAGFWNVGKVAVWNRSEFYPLGGDGDGVTGGTKVNDIAIDARGNVLLAGDFTGATNDDLCDYLATWNGTRFAHLDLVPGAECFAIAAKFDKLFVGYNGASVTAIADVQAVTNEGAASAYPILDILGPLTLRYLENQETGKIVRFNLTIQAGERVMIDLRPGYLKAISEWNGNVMYGIMGDSDFGDFALLPGHNTIAFLGTGGDGNEEASLRWQMTDWSFDDVR